MWKALLVVAVTANTFLLTPSEATKRCLKPNEVYDVCPAPCPPRECGVNKTLILCAPGPKIGDPSCKPACRCADGFLRNKTGVCIPESKCPRQCPENEVFDTCVAPCPPLVCGVNKALIQCAPCPKHGDSNCIASCRCANGYLRNKAGKCIPEKECPQKCPKNEVFDICPATCPPLNCGVNKALIKCAAPLKPGDPKCKPSCRCADGFLRNKDGTCIPEAECPRKCPKNEVFDFCPATCPPLECGVDKTLIKCAAPLKPGDPKCKPSCRCADGFLRNKNGTCIPEAECPRKCPKNEVFDFCPATCPPLECGVDKTLIKCAPPLKPGDPQCKPSCRCADGFLRNKDGSCIPEAECPRKCPKNEVFDFCPPTCPPLECGVNKTLIKCPAPHKPHCNPSCRCADGFLRNKAGVCVPEAECPLVCGTNEELSPCSNGGCGPWTCLDLGFPTGCVKMDPKNCREGCVCKEGFVKNANGTCIPSTECPECGGDPNAIAGCGKNCGRLCSNYNKGPVSCTAECRRNACDCREGFVLDEFSNKCVRPFECKCNKPNEHYDPCPPKCPPQTCESIGKTYNCPLSTAVCQGECRCDKGYFRNKIGACIKGDDCLKCTGPNEFFSCGGACDNVCATINKQNQTNCPIVNIKCNPMCYCEEGYARDANNTCIPIEKCPVSCGGDPNAKPGCGNHCGRRCSDHRKGPAVCPLICNIHGCDCKDGFVYDDNLKKCVLPKDCTRVCNKHEVYDFCANGGCKKRNCSQLGQPDICIKVKHCIGGCVCAEGFLRAKNGTCVPEKQCPIPTCGKNERFEWCPGGKCLPQSCSEVGFPLQCHEVSDKSSCQGPPKCICKDGYVRKRNGKCISIKKCRSCGGDPNAVSGCGTNSCNRLCSNYNKPPVPCPKICKVNACDCKKGFVFDEKISKCVLPKQCSPICGKDEVFSECINGGCQAKNCSQLGKPVPCIKIDPKFCIKGCLCKEGYLRRDDGVCVPKDKCNHCHKPNEHYDPCPPTCPPQTCESIGKTHKCPKIKTVCKGACRCDKGYFRNKIGECIKEKDCLKCRGPHEYFSCGGACDNVCLTLHKQNQTNCPIVNIKCNPMCYCEKGYARDNNKTCVPIKKCPVSCGGDPNAKPGCGTHCGRRCSDHKKGPAVCPTKCNIHGCDCKDGFVYDDNLKKCVLPKDCTRVCNKHEVYDFCANGGCKKRNCSQLGQPDICIKVKHCIGGCVCAEGFLRAKNGTCVPVKQCPTPICGKDEVFSECINGGCQAKNCSQLGKPVPCIKIDPKFCIKGCLCKEGYLRRDDGVCVPKDKCNHCHKPNEHYDPCPPTCPPQTCESIGKTHKCPKIKTVCKGACRCDKGYFRNKIGECIKEKDCLKCRGPHEYFSCGGACDNVCLTLHKQNQTNCPIVNIKCNPMCYCEKGYARDNNKTCIPIKKCPVSCGGDPNAKPGCGTHCGRRCSDHKKGPAVCPTKCNIHGCDCKDGFVYDDNLKKCVLPKDCTRVCNKHEVYDFCANGGCKKRNCSQLGQPDICIKVKHCIGGCVCAEGFLRAKNGTCVPVKQCPTPICGKDEVFSECINGGCQAKNCSQLGKPVPCIKIDPKFCIKGCLCKEGYLRRDDGVCVPKDKCNHCHKPNEHYDPCPPTCPPQTCESIGKTHKCPKIKTVCKGACRCDKGYFRNKIGECIKEKDCLKCRGPHEYFSCGGACDNVCLTLHKQNQTNCPIVNIKCNPMCYCEKGYARDNNKTCVPIKKCPVSCGGDPNAKPGCGTHCGRRCSDHKKGPAVCPTKCNIHGCDCKDGFVYDDNLKKCVLPKDCTRVCNKHEVYDFCANGGCKKRNCSQLGQPDICIKVKHCIGGCVCAEGFLRAKNGTCVPVKQCPTPICGKDEVFSECINGGCQAKNCSQLGKPVPCIKIDPKFCIKGCLCKEGYLRRDDGVCVPKDKCNHCHKPNEHYDPCPPTCPPQTCESIGKTHKCPKIKTVCKGACRCDKGYFRNKIGECIKEKDCLKCRGPHEYFSCGGACDNVCLTLHKQNQTNCPIVNIKCNPMCYCEKGYARDNNKTCVPIKKCPVSCGGDPNAKPGCGTHCGRRCSDHKKGPAVCPTKCNIHGCDCKDGFVYDDNLKKCVLPKDCTRVCNKHEVYDFCANGGCKKRNCSQLGQPDICIKVKHCIGGCVCAEGFLRAKNGTCVPVKQCPTPICGKDEVFSECINGGCQAKNCSQLGKPVPCIKIDPKFCIKGCLCKEGYLRRDDGVCVPKDKCNHCHKPNEHYDPCPPTCPPQTCESIGKTHKCPKIKTVCKGACRCDKGYFRNKIGECIKEKDCLKCRGPHEYFSCGGACDNVCLTLHKQNQTNCPIVNIKCNPMCYCEKGYARDNNKTCVPIKKCPVSCGGDPNAKPGCGTHCGRRCSDHKKGPAVCPTKCNIHGCDCKDGFVYDDNLKKCVLPKDCTRVCNKHEVYDFCANGGCKKRNCSQLGQPDICIKVKHCIGGCVCAEGFLRAKNGTCVPVKQCPTPICGKDEVFSECINGGCQAKNCSQLGKPVPCIKIDPKFCIKGCLCKEGYLRRDDGVCVPKDKCNHCHKPNEHYDPCPPTCPPQTCESIGKTHKCPKIKTVCKGACRCDKGYFRNKIGECIKEKDCLKCRGPHEYFSCGGACDNVCLTLHKQNQTNCPIVNIKCNPMCYCEKGYARDNNKTCVPIKKCPVSCGGDPNAKPGCGTHCGRRCSDHKKGPAVCPTKCNIHGCDCKDGFVYDDNLKKCVLPKDCTRVCNKHEVYDFCANGGCKKRNCSQLGQPDICIKVKHCIGGCVCAEGFLRAKNGTCVPVKQCPTPICGKDEVFSECINGGCQAKNCSQLGKPVPCIKIDPKFCIKGCLCKEGYLRRDDGVCVPKDKCNHCHKPNEHYDPCPPTCPPQTCESIGKTHKCPKIKTVCKGACRCDKGYFRNKIGECIKEKDCLKCRGPHEYFSCGGACDNVCLTLHKQNQTNCPIVNIKCNPMCYCEKGYARDNNKTCVPIKKCPVSCGGDPNAKPGCGTHCGRRCSDHKKGPAVCPTKCNIHGCDCKDGFVYDDNLKKCVLPKDCTRVCNKHEVYDFCANGGCKKRNCSQLGQPDICIKVKHCIGGCVCAEGFLRAKNGTCVPVKQCPTPICGKDEVFSECINGGCQAKNCSQLGKPVPCIKIDPKFCIKGCLCKEGYLRRDDGVCVPKDKCNHCHKPNEHYDPCPPTCPPQTCESIGKTHKCPKIKTVCKGACRCDKGYFRNKIGECIKEKDCLKCRGPHEYFSCGGACDNVCLTLHKQNQTNCPIVNIKCNPMCYCEKGYARDNNKTCVPIKKCPVSCGGDPNAKPGCGTHCGRRCSDHKKGPAVCPTKCNIHGCDCKDGFVYDDNLKKCVLPKDCTRVCNKHEVYDFCANGGCKKRNCSQLGQPDICIKVKHCIGGCVCAEGFLRAKNGTCVPVKQCPTPICGKDEVFSECINGGCQAKNCSQLGKPVPCIKIDPKFCIKGCLCKEGYLRRDDGVCVPKDKCNHCHKPNEHYDPCPPTCPPQTCESIGKTHKCPKIKTVCKGACRCDKGYFRNKIGECIKEKDCLKCRGPHEYFSCGGACDNVCLTLHKQNQTNCPIVNIKCNPMCYCEKGYARDNNKTCVPIKKCPVSCGGDPNAKPGCGTHCGRRCSDHKKGPAVCPTKCNIHGCDCKDGFVYDDNLKKCVLPKDCTRVCNKHEVYDFCANGGCKKRNCSQLGQPDICIKVKHCIGGCVCAEGFLRAKNGTCVPVKQCPTPICGKDEVFSECINGGCQAKNCSQLGKPVPCIKIDPKFCIKGCLCKEGYLRRDDGVCVPKDKCNHCHKPNEHYDPCPPTCPPQTCESIGKTHKCPKIKTVCKGACRCDKGYFRNKIGECIKEKDCLKCRGPHEYFSCGGACDNVCLTLHKQNQTNCPIVNIKCNPMCYCEKGYARDNNKTCVPIKKCPVSCGGDPNAKPGCGTHCGRRCSDHKKGPAVCPTKCNIHGCDCKDGFVYDDNLKKCVLPKDCTRVCNKHEVYDFCANGGCKKRNCSQLGQPDICIKVKHCIGGCVCAEGFLRAKNGTCVPVKQCPTPICGKDEVFSECINGGCQAKNCSQLGKPVPCIKIDPKFCIKGCLCKEGYLRRDDGVCVPKDKCNHCHKPNEHYDPCPPTCPPQTCESIGKTHKCPKIKTVCKGACRCDKGYFRNKIGECIKEKDCLKCRGPHEYFSCGGACDNECLTLHKQNQTNCPIVNIKCNPMCYCEKGYARDNNKTCVPIKKCPVSCGGDPNAKPGCGTHCGRRCSDHKKGPAVCPTKCNIHGCDCKDGFVYDDNLKKCVLPKDCTRVCNKHEVYDFCANGGCKKRNCSQLGQPDICIKVKHCIGGCVCAEGFLRAKNGTCVPEKQCPTPVCGINEIYDTCSNAGCQKRNCSQLGHPDLCIDVTKCFGGCVCKEGFLRTIEGHCVPLKKCPIPTCPKNQRFEWCPETLCIPQSCADIGFPVPCPVLAEDSGCPGPPRCVCNEGYVRNSDEKCVPVKQCPSCGGDPNAVSGCGTNSCNRLCSNYNKPPVPCPKICKVNACDCKNGFVFDEKISKCVLPKKCSPICGKDEVFSECINGGCQAKNCSQLGKPVPCIKIDPKFCIKGCLCKEGYLRRDDGVCVPKDKCNHCHKPNEHYDPCPPTCPPQTCESIGKNYKCPKIKPVCKGACRCDKGYFRNKIGECIKEKDCLKCRGPHEYFSCGGACDNVCLTLHKQNQTNCPIANIKCNPMCYCEKGYARDNNNTCVPIKKCPVSCGGDPNAKPGCGTHCGRRCSDHKKGPAVCPLICNIHGCDCKDGFVYDDNLNKCVLPKDCTPVCGNNEVYDTCANGGCQKRNCSQLGQPKLCIDPIKCNGGCVCQAGYLRAKNGTCVPEKQCPAPQCKAGERYELCPDWLCTAQTCSQVGFPIACPGISSDASVSCPGSPACVCDNNYVRNDEGKCVPLNQCPSCGGDPNAVSGCGVNCGRLCSNYNRTDVACITGCYPNACDCKKGYVLDENTNQCVRPKQCTPVCGKNEIYDTCYNAGSQKRNCSQLGDPDRCNYVTECFAGCVCKKGFLRTKEGHCVPQKECPIPTCPNNERFVWCPEALCIPQSCTDVGFPVPCPVLAEDSGCPGPPKCVCNEGYVRNSKGKCVPVKECPSCGGDPNAVSGCGTNSCNRLCSNYNKPPVPCPKICKFNACDCKKGFVFDEKISKCVLPKKCTPVCGNNEVYDTCANGGCQKRNCSQFGQPTLCIDPIKCNGGCVCQAGYLRAKNGTCVPENQCPGICGKPNEFYDPCPPICPPQTCDSLNNKYFCPVNIINGTKVCRGACRCKQGFFRNSVGKCILKSDCLKCTGPNEHYACGGACDNVCAELSKQNQTNCPIINKKCNPKCYCDEGYARDDNNICIPIKQCGEKCEKSHEVFKSCPSTCPPQTCESLDRVYVCPIITGQEPPCHPGCVCEDGYYRNKLGQCVTQKDCGNTTSTAVNITEATERLNDGAIIAAGKFLYQLASRSPNENIILSGTSVIIALAQLSLFTIGLVLEQLLTFFNLRNKDEIRAVFPELLKSYQNQTHVDFSSVTKYYANKHYPLSAYFKQESKRIFNSTGENLDFSKAEEAAKSINKWVNDNTNGKIQDLVKPDMFSTDTRLVLVNAIYFLGNWVHQFNPNNTEHKDFYKSNGDKVTVEMMYQKNNFDYTENDQYQALKMRYKGNAFSCVVVLPREKDGLLDTIKILQNPKDFKNMLKKLQRQEVEVNIPKMLIKTEMDIAEMLQKENVTAMFNPNNKNFENVLEKKEDLFVSAAVQQAYLSFNEVGTEATAATAVVVNTRSLKPMPAAVFNANHPYIFYIMFGDTVLFCGSFVK